MKRSVFWLLLLVAGIIQCAMAQGSHSISHTGDVWVEQLNNSKIFVDVHAFSPMVVWAVTDVGLIFKTTNGGNTWVSIDTVTCGVHDLVVIDDQIALLAGCSSDDGMSKIFRTTNGGTVWDTVYMQPSAGHITAMCMIDANNGVAMGRSPIPAATEFVALYTTNGGATWPPMLNPPTGGVVRDSPWRITGSGPTHMWVLQNSTDRISRTTDGGHSWLEDRPQFDNPVPVPTYSQSVAFNDEDHGVLGLWEHSIAWTANGGVSWTHVDLPSFGPVNSVVGYGVDFFAARGGFVFWSKDRGHTWSTSYDGSVGTINMLTVACSGSNLHVWAASDHGGIVYAKLGVTGVEGGESRIPTDFALEQNYPNPFNPSTTIRYGLPHKSAVQLIVFNTLGQEVAALQNGEQEAGYHDVKFDASGLSSGVYFYRIHAGSFVETRKLVLLR